MVEAIFGMEYVNRVLPKHFYATYMPYMIGELAEVGNAIKGYVKQLIEIAKYRNEPLHAALLSTINLFSKSLNSDVRANLAVPKNLNYTSVRFWLRDTKGIISDKQAIRTITIIIDTIFKAITAEIIKRSERRGRCYDLRHVNVADALGPVIKMYDLDSIKLVIDEIKGDNSERIDDMAKLDIEFD